jgi:prepilin-type N-terminal cleavage/methylation domain-containing protein
VLRAQELLPKFCFFQDKQLLIKNVERSALRGVKQSIVHHDAQEGFTLIEVLISIVIFSLSLFALVPLLTTATRIDRENYLNVKARAMAADTLDTLMGDVPAGTNPSTETDGGVVLMRSWNVTPVGNLDHIVVTVQYTSHGELKTVTLSARKAR